MSYYRCYAGEWGVWPSTSSQHVRQRTFENDRVSIISQFTSQITIIIFLTVLFCVFCAKGKQFVWSSQQYIQLLTGFEGNRYLLALKMNSARGRIFLVAWQTLSPSKANSSAQIILQTRDICFQHDEHIFATESKIELNIYRVYFSQSLSVRLFPGGKSLISWQ